MTEVIEKAPSRAYRVGADNFERVPAGEVYAESLDGDHVLRAGTDVWPVLMSADGHGRLLGYTASEARPIEAAVPGAREAGDPADAAERRR